MPRIFKRKPKMPERRLDGRSWPRKNFSLHAEAASSGSQIVISKMHPKKKVDLAFGTRLDLSAKGNTGKEKALKHLGTTIKGGKQTNWYEERRKGWVFKKKI